MQICVCVLYIYVWGFWHFQHFVELVTPSINREVSSRRSNDMQCATNAQRVNYYSVSYACKEGNIRVFLQLLMPGKQLLNKHYVSARSEPSEVIQIEQWASKPWRWRMTDDSSPRPLWPQRPWVWRPPARVLAPFLAGSTQSGHIRTNVHSYLHFHSQCSKEKQIKTHVFVQLSGEENSRHICLFCIMQFHLFQLKK